jgi:hypothetical protein
LITIPEDQQNQIIAALQQHLVTSGIPILQTMAIDADDLIQRVKSYQSAALAKHQDPYGKRTLAEIAEFLYSDITYDYGQSDAGM